MAPKSRTAAAVKVRKSPRQRRSGETVAAIVEAAARILEKKGFGGFNTNAVAEEAGVSIGSLYQYFPSKQALLNSLIEREMEPLLAEVEELAQAAEFRAALRRYVRASVRNQMRRPELARLIDIAERQEIFEEQISSAASRLLAVMERMLQLRDGPRVGSAAAVDVVAVIRALTDAAGARAEGASFALVERIEGAVLGYLDGARL